MSLNRDCTVLALEMFCWACHRNSCLSYDQQNRNTFYHRTSSFFTVVDDPGFHGAPFHVVKSLIHKCTLHLLKQKSSKKCSYLYSRSNQRRGYFFNLRCFYLAFGVFKVFKAVGLELFIVRKPKKNYRYFSFEVFSSFLHSELFLT